MNSQMSFDFFCVTLKLSAQMRIERDFFLHYEDTQLSDSNEKSACFLTTIVAWYAQSLVIFACIGTLGLYSLLATLNHT